ncbi:hypothetical protein JOM56_007239 [Amanita muscaria]
MEETWRTGWGRRAANYNSLFLSGRVTKALVLSELEYTLGQKERALQANLYDTTSQNHVNLRTPPGIHVTPLAAGTCSRPQVDACFFKDLDQASLLAQYEKESDTAARELEAASQEAKEAEAELDQRTRLGLTLDTIPFKLDKLGMEIEPTTFNFAAGSIPSEFRIFFKLHSRPSLR